MCNKQIWNITATLLNEASKDMCGTLIIITTPVKLYNHLLLLEKFG